MKMGKQIFVTLLAVMLILTGIPLTGFVSLGEELLTIANAATSGDYEYKVLEDGTAEITDYNGDGGHEDIMSSIQADLEAIGIKVTQNTLEWAAYLNSLSEGSYGLARLGWTADYPIQDNFLYPNFFSTADNNYNHYNNPDFDAAIMAARQIADEEQRREAYRAACGMVGDDMPVIPIMFYAHNYVGSERMASFNYDAATIPHFETAQIA